MTSLKKAVSVLQAQEKSPGEHELFGPEIRFTENPPPLQKTDDDRGVILRAQVDLGRSTSRPKSEVDDEECWADIRDEDEYDSVVLEGDPDEEDEDEYVVFESQSVTSIKLYQALGYLYTGTLQVSADGSRGTGWTMEKYPVRIVLIWPRANSPYPVLLGDNNSDQLGWASPNSLTIA
jgi:hypothetical protein